MRPEYHDFELDIGIGHGREYPVAVRRSPAGEARAKMHFPFDEQQLAGRLKDLQIALLRSGGRRRRALTPEQEDVRNFGASLFDALMAGDVRSLYDISQERTIGAGNGLRLKLRFASPDLAALPWEFLYDTRRGQFVSLSRHTPLVRYIDLPHPPRALEVAPPLRVLGMVAGPNDLPELDIAAEKERVERALAGLMEAGMAELVWMAGATWRDLQRAMRRGPWHIFHFVGHGAFDRTAGEGLVMFCDEHGNARPLRATELGRLLADHWTLRLAVLNACEGARGSDHDLFSSTASLLVQRGLPAVLAMQYEITDRAAVELSRAFYESLADGLPVDAAVAEARKAVSLAISNTVEWGTPVLTMRAPDGVLFRLEAVAESARPRQTATLELASEPELTLRLEATPNPAPAGAEVTWTVTVTNDGGQDLMYVSVFRERTLLEDPFKLAIGEQRTLVFKTRNEEPCAVTERVNATGFTANGRFALDEACTTVLVEVEVEAGTAPAAPPRVAGKAAGLTIIDPLAMEFVMIPAGKFLMGSDPAVDRDAAELEQPLHRLHLDDYYIARTPVTNAHYARFVAALGHTTPGHWKEGKPPRGREDHPVVMVSWEDALRFCRWLRKSTGRQFFLPTEAHWEKAACWDSNAGDRRLYPFGNLFDPGKCNSYESGIGATTPVGAYSPGGDSRYGVADMAGNVYEWTSTSLRAYPYDPYDGREVLASGGKRVLRGGSYYDVGWVARCGSRFHSNYDNRFPYFGFRVVLYL
ncbi:MAG: SUMF1/EgtB/PvdO family nonheme iron enzyme [Anaerolineae bacterium]|nr:SUMF1/EgtB/PvdO family nonheme iron enzyme [Anaerolineae bacterium]